MISKSVSRHLACIEGPQLLHVALEFADAGLRLRQSLDQRTSSAGRGCGRGLSSPRETAAGCRGGGRGEGRDARLVLGLDLLVLLPQTAQTVVVLLLVLRELRTQIAQGLGPRARARLVVRVHNNRHTGGSVGGGGVAYLCVLSSLLLDGL